MVEDLKIGYKIVRYQLHVYLLHSHTLQIQSNMLCGWHAHIHRGQDVLTKSIYSNRLSSSAQIFSTC